MKYKPVDLSQVKTYPLRERKSKVSIEDFGRPAGAGESFSEFLNHIPRILAGRDFFELIASIVKAFRDGKMVLANIGAHVIKCGLSPTIIQFMEKGILTCLSMNGAASIHDFEIALIGKTSEDVDVALKDGSFGMAEETGRLMNEAINAAEDNGLGMGEALGRKLLEIKAPHISLSILARAINLDIPVTVHVAIGTDIIHQHPLSRGKTMGETSFLDFKLLTSLISQLGPGGVVLNFGSAVIFPEVFLKALSIVRNLGHKVVDFTTANFDIVGHYRPIQNVVRRPVSLGGKGYSFIGHHEIMIPLLAGAIMEKLNER
ncbi:hypothetical protein LR007_02570 [candidate division NPL-UPA2 bacterium]|nr:hypothetical protein [candidate division NPL-UPA2 bacterium]